MGKYFGTDGFRGAANETLTAMHAFEIGRFLGWYFGKRLDKKSKILIGKDTRLSSYMFEYSIVAGITASGGDAYLLHVTTTPSVAFVCRNEDFDCAVMISASHNVYTDNGIKIFDGVGEKIDDNFIEILEKHLSAVEQGASSEVPLATGNEIGKIVDYIAARNRYVGYLISLGRFSFRGKKVGLDCANGSSWTIAKAVFEALGARTFVINAEPDGTNINENAGSTHIDGLRKLVTENKLDVGFAFDGDADRCIAVDEKGNVIDGDYIIYICAKYLAEHGELTSKAVAVTSMSNQALILALRELGIECYITDVGDRYVYEQMQKSSLELGGEKSGHIIFSKYATTGDGLLTSLMVMEVMLSRKLPLSKLAEPLKMMPSILKNVKVKNKQAVLESRELIEVVERVKAELAGGGRVLVRASGTEQLIRIFVECNSEKKCKLYSNMIEKVVKNLNL